MAVTVLPSIVIGFVWHPLGTDHIELLLGSVIAGGFTFWTVSNFIRGVYTSMQGIYKRDEAPILYWTHTIIISAATALVIFYWFHQIRAVTGRQSVNKSSSRIAH